MKWYDLAFNYKNQDVVKIVTREEGIMDYIATMLNIGYTLVYVKEVK